MISSYSPVARKIAAGLLAAASVAASSPSFSQTDESAATRQRQIVESIESEQTENGPLSEGLIRPLGELALAYYDSGDQALAAGVVERIRQIVRTHYGIYSLLQAPLIERLIDYENANGNRKTALDLEQELMILAEHHPDDLRTVPILREIADDRLRRGDGADHLRLYERAIEVLHRNDLYNAELRDLEMEFVRMGGCDMGRQSWQRLMEYDDKSKASLLDRVTTLVRSADFDLACSQTKFSLQRPAHEAYEQAYEMLERGGVDQAAIDRFFPPTIPVLLQTGTPPSSFLGVGDEHAAYIDIAFVIDGSGRTRSVKIVGERTKATDQVKRGYLSTIRGALFRPGVTHGRVEDSKRVVRFALEE